MGIGVDGQLSQRAVLEVIWLNRRHRVRHLRRLPIPTGSLAKQAENGELTVRVQRWLAATGWTITPDLLCRNMQGTS